MHQASKKLHANFVKLNGKCCFTCSLLFVFIFVDCLSENINKQTTNTGLTPQSNQVHCNGFKHDFCNKGNKLTKL